MLLKHKTACFWRADGIRSHRAVQAMSVVQAVPESLGEFLGELK